jgi:U3 small nucleolar RNA-associated protein 14
LVNFVSKLAKGRKSSSSAASASSGPTTTKRRIREMAAPLLSGENEYESLRGSAASAPSLSVDALMSGNAKGVRKEVQASLAEVCTPNSAAKPRASDVVEERVVRKTAYSERSSELGAQWEQAVKVNRNAETLDLRDKTPKSTLSAASMVSKFAPTTDMELEITRLLEGKGSDAAVTAHETAALEESGLSPEQVRARQGELAKMRSLLFYEQQKRRRINKIKSKAYHRIRNRQQRRREGEEGDGEQGAEQTREEEVEAEEKEALRRMQERMSLKHKNTSKWARQQLKAGGQHSSVRAAIGEQLRIGDELRRKASRPDGERGGGDSDDDSDSSDESDGEEGDEEGIEKAKAATQTLILGIEADGKKADSKGASAGGLMGMKFMQRAVSKQREAARSEAQALLDDLTKQGEGLEDEDDGDAEDEGDYHEGQSLKEKAAEEAAAAAAASNGPAPTMMGATLEVSKLSQAGRRLRVDDAITIEPTQQQQQQHPQASSGPAASKVRGPAVSGKAATAAAAGSAQDKGDDLVNLWIEPQAAASSSSSSRRKTSKNGGGSSMGGLAVLDIDKATSEALHGVQQQRQKQEEDTHNKQQKKQQQQSGGSASKKEDADSSSKPKDAVRELTQAELVQRAFASPDFEKEFANEKREATEGKPESRAQQAAALESDGWGSWAGVGAPPPRPPPSAGGSSKKKNNDGGNKRKRGRDDDDKPAPPPKPKAAADKDLKDKSMPLVIVSQKRIKAAARLKVSEVPYPFTSREQYERTLDVPAGKEWNGMRAVRGFARPAVITDMGRTIAPIKKMKQPKAQPVGQKGPKAPRR